MEIVNDWFEEFGGTILRDEHIELSDAGWVATPVQFDGAEWKPVSGVEIEVWRDW